MNARNLQRYALFVSILLLVSFVGLPLAQAQRRGRQRAPVAAQKRTPPRTPLRQTQTIPPVTTTPIAAFNPHALNPAVFSGLPSAVDQMLAAVRPRRRGKAFDQPEEWLRYYLKTRLPEGETELPVEKYFAAREEMDQMAQFSTALDRALPSRAELRAANLTAADPDQAKLGEWTWLGPGNIGGRTRALLVHPADPNIMLAAAVAGGIWRSTNAGASWTPVGDLLANIAFVSMAFDPKNPSVVYAGTGEGFFNGDAVRGAGIFVSRDAGLTWARLANTNTSDFYYVNDLVVSPNDGRRVYAATRTGVWRSIDGGTTWVRALPVTVQAGCTDLAIRTDKVNDYMFAACGSFAQATVYRAATAESDFFALGRWTPVLTETGMGRTAIAIAPSNQDIVYAVTAEYLAGPLQHGLHAFFKSSASGDPNSWQARVRNTDTGNKLGRAMLSTIPRATATDCKIGTGDNFTGQGWYDLTIAVDPLDENRVWVGGIDLLRSDDGGGSWGLAGYSYLGANFALGRIHPDQHTIIFHPNYNGTTNQQMFVGNDGGLYRTSNARAVVGIGNTAQCNPSSSQVVWTSLNNNYGATQFYHGSVTPDGATYFGGTQDNGTVRGTDANGPNKWQMILGADGGYGGTSDGNAFTFFTSTQGGNFWKSTDAGETFSLATFGLTGGFPFITAVTLDPSDRQRVYTGGTTLFRSENGASTWTPIVSALTPGTVSAIAVAPTDANTVLVGYSDGSLFRSNRTLSLRTGLTLSAPTEELAAPRSGNVSWVAFDPNDRNIAYATYSTFGGTHVWRTTNGGASWSGIDGGMAANTRIPDIPVHCIVVDPANSARLYVGTDLGVFVSNDTGATWSVENTGFANVVTETLVLNIKDGAETLYAFTHGRGAYRVLANRNGCNFGLSSAGRSFDAMGGDTVVNVTINPAAGCTWRAESNAPWITLQGNTAGSSNGSVSVKIAANTGFTTRIGTVNIAGRSYTVTQTGMADTVAPTIALVNPPPNQLLVSTTQASINVTGTASDNNAVQSVTWRSSAGVSGTATLAGTGWAVNALPLVVGLNTLTFTAIDAVGNAASTELQVFAQPPSVLLTIAGSGATGFDGDNKPALQAGLSSPYRIAFDSDANMYIADDVGQRIRKVSPSGVITTVAGNGTAGFSGDGGPATAAQLNFPSQTAIDRDGNLYIADYTNNRVRKVTVATGIISTVAGRGAAGFAGDGGPAVDALINGPDSVGIGRDGNLYIADANNHRIRRVNLSTGVITTVAGNGTTLFSGDGGPATAAGVSLPLDVAFDSVGDLYIASSGAGRVRKVTLATGVITTVAGNGSTTTADGLTALNSGFSSPSGIAFDVSDNLYIAATGNARIRRVDAATRIVTTLAGGATGFSPDGAGAVIARLSNPVSVAVNRFNQVRFTDTGNARVRTVAPAPAADTAAPVVTITTPTNASSFTATSSPIALTGTATDNIGVAVVRWTNNRGGGGTAAGTASWTIPFVSLQPGANVITVTAWDGSGQQGSAQLTINYAPQQILLTVAGTGVNGSRGDGGPGLAADLSLPRGVVVDAMGNVYFADQNNRRVRRLDPAGRVTNFAGTGELGSGGDGGLAVNATLNSPTGLALDAAGNLYISDSNANRVRKVTVDGKITSIAGSGRGFGDYTGDDVPALETKLNGPQGLSVDTAGNLFIADRGNHRIRRVDARTGLISTVAGNGQPGFSGDGGPATAASLFAPSGVAVDRAGNIYIADELNQRIRRVDAAGQITTIAGTGAAGFNGDGIPARTATLALSFPSMMTLDPAGNPVFADRSNHRIRRINLATGLIETLAGTGLAGFAGDGGAPLGANLLFPNSAAFDAAGNLYIADGSNNRIRRTLAISSLLTVTSVSAASFAANGELAPDSIAAGFGMNLASATVNAATVPLPLSLGGVTVKVRDALGIERLAPLFMVSDRQINYLVPNGSAPGLATVIVETDRGELAIGTMTIANIAPALFTVDATGRGLPSAVVVRVRAGQVSYEPVSRFDAATNRFVAVPIDLGPEGDQVFLALYGTGFRNLSSVRAASATVGGTSATVTFVGAVPGLIGLDQANIELPRTLAGRGEVDVILTVAGKAANTVRITLR